MSKPINSSLDFLYKNYSINLNTVAEVKELILHSKNRVSKLIGSLGIMNLRGRHDKSKVVFNSKESLDESQLDFMVKSIGTFPINIFADYSFGNSSSINILKHISKLINVK